MTTVGAVLVFVGLILLIGSGVVWDKATKKEKQTKAPGIMATIAGIILSVGAYLFEEEVYAIIGIGLVVFFNWISKKFKKFAKQQQSIKDKLANDPNWEVERRIEKRLAYTSLELGGSFQFYPSQPYGEKYKGNVKANLNRCVDFLKDGALMVATHQLIDPNSSAINGRGLYIYTPNALFRKTKAAVTGEVNLNDIMPAGSEFGIKEHIKEALVTKKVSVADAAAAGAILAGTAGAVVGAAHAMDTNANGGKSELVSKGSTLCIQLFTHGIDCIFISKEILKMCVPPPAHCVSVETNTYWILDSHLEEWKTDRQAHQKLKETLDYLNDIVAKIKISSEKNQ